MAISFKYMKDLQTLKAWNGRNMYYNLAMSELKKVWYTCLSISFIAIGKVSQHLPGFSTQ